jgi:hypothetical protein
MRVLLALLLLVADDPPAWTRAVPGEFPAAGTAREISGELIGLDHVNRTGTLRVDRNDSQRTDDYDAAMPFMLLPYAKTMFHGSYAELRDVPIGRTCTASSSSGRCREEPEAGLQPRAAARGRLQPLRPPEEFWRVDAVELDKHSSRHRRRRRRRGRREADDVPDRPATRVWKGAASAR